MNNKKKYVIIAVYVLINVLVPLFTKSIIYFGDSVGITSIALGLIIIFQPQLFGNTDKKKLYIYPIALGVILLFMTNFI